VRRAEAGWWGTLVSFWGRGWADGIYGTGIAATNRYLLEITFRWTGIVVTAHVEKAEKLGR
jgi:hypothetical protein